MARRAADSFHLAGRDATPGVASASIARPAGCAAASPAEAPASRSGRHVVKAMQPVERPGTPSSGADRSRGEGAVRRDPARLRRGVGPSLAIGSAAHGRPSRRGRGEAPWIPSTRRGSGDALPSAAGPTVVAPDPARRPRPPCPLPAGGPARRVKIHEADAKSLLVAQGLPVPPWTVAHTAAEARAAAQTYLADPRRMLAERRLRLGRRRS